MLYQPLPAGHVLDGLYTIQARVGEGAMGTVYRALDGYRQRAVGIKVLKPDAAEDDRAPRLFLREARAMARLDHPGIVSVYGSGTTQDGMPYLVMEWIEGRPLSKVPLPPRLETVVALIDRVLEALAHAHARGVIHRDLKPANILLAGQGEDITGDVGRGAVKLVDFGVARIFDAQRASSPPPPPAPPKAARSRSFAAVAQRGLSLETQPHEVKAEGTPRYMAPELYRGKEGLIGPPNDLYAVGVLLYELLTGQKLYDTYNPAALMSMQLLGEIPQVIVRPELGARYAPQALLERLLTPDPFARIQHSAEARRELQAWHREQGASAGIPAGLVLPAAPLWEEDDPLQQTHSAPRITFAGSPPELTLLSWRPLPVLGRAAEQAWLWHHLEEVGAGEGGRALVIQGDNGLGKSHLARWLAEAAAEDGSAVPLWCDLHGGGLLEGVRAALDRQLYTQGLDGDPLRQRLRGHLERQGLAFPTLDAPVDDPRWASLAAHEVELLARLLRPGEVSGSGEQVALSVLAADVERRPGDLKLRGQLAAALERAGRYGEAVQHHEARAQELARQGSWSEAAAVCQSILRLRPDHEPTRLLLARAYAQQQAAQRTPGPAPEDEEVIVLSASRAIKPVSRAGGWAAGGFDFKEDSTASGAMTALGRGEWDERTCALVGRALARLGRTAPILLVLDGVEPQEREAVLRLIAYLLAGAGQGEARLLAVVTSAWPLRDGGLESRALAALERLEAAGVLLGMELGPLGEAHMEAVLQRFERLSDPQRAEIQSRAAGNPLFAVELARHLLDHGDAGLEGRLPESVAEVWRRRLLRMAALHPGGAAILRGLELAAVLGEPIRAEILRAAWLGEEVREVRGETPAGINDAIWELWLEAGILFEERPGRARFTQPMLRETLLADLDGEERLVRYHEAAASAYLRLRRTQQPQHRLQLALHLVEAGQPAQAWPWAAEAAQHLLDRSAWRAAEHALGLCELILRLERASSVDPRRDPIDLGYAQLARRAGDIDAARQRAEALRARGVHTGLATQLGMGELILAEIAAHLGQDAEAHALFDRAFARFQTCDEPRGQAEALLGLARCALRAGQPQGARTRLDAAEHLLKALADPNGLARAYALHGQVERLAGNPRAAAHLLEEAARAFERAGNSVGLARVLGEQGQVALDLGDLERAEVYFQAWLRQSEALGDRPAVAQARANLGQTLLRLQRPEPAEEILQRALRDFREQGDEATATIVHLLLALAQVQRRRWGPAVLALRHCLDALARLRFADLDVAEALEAVARTPGAASSLGPLYADLCYAAADQWRQLGATPRADALLLLLQ